MPSSMTHTYFGLDVYSKLNTQSKEKISNSLEYFKLFSQGSDPFMFYNFLIGKKAKKYSDVQGIIHTKKTREFFITTIKYINENNLSNNPDVMAYLYGYICHYFLDLYTHPFIYYKSGKFKKEDKNTYKYNGLHQTIEYAIDLYFINKKENISSSKFKIYKEIFNVSSLSKELKDLIKVSIEGIYKVKDASIIYQRCIYYMKYFYRIFNYDPYGIKLKMYRLIDNLTPKSTLKIKELSFYNTYKEINSFLNLDNNNWYYPWDNTKVNTSSFLDLYNWALYDSVKTIEEVTKMLDNNNIDINKLNILFKDLSYVTGLKCNKQVNLKYFEF